MPACLPAAHDLSGTKSNGSESGAIKITWCEALCPRSVLASRTAKSSYSGRLSLCVLSPNGNSSSTRRRMDPAGFEPASVTWTECCVPVTPRALSGVSVLVQPSARSCVTILLVGCPNWEEIRFLGLRSGQALDFATALGPFPHLGNPRDVGHPAGVVTTPHIWRFIKESCGRRIAAPQGMRSTDPRPPGIGGP